MSTISAPESINPKAGMWAWMAYELRFQRTKRGESLTEAGQHVPTSRKTVQNWEAGRHRPSEEACRRLDAAWQTGGLLERIYYFATTSHDPNWFAEYLRYEAHSSTIRAYEVSWVPGLLQTEEYARAVLLAGRSSRLEDQVAERLARQEVLDRDDPPYASFIIDESAFLRIRGHAFAREQIAKILDLTERPNIIIRVSSLDAGLHVGLNGPFELLSTRSGDVAYTDAAVGGRLVVEEEGVRSCQLAFDQIGADALSRNATKELLRRMQEETHD